MPDDAPDTWPRPPLLTRVASWLLHPRGGPSAQRLRAAVAGKTVLITGASFGIGEACARQFAAAGAKVILVARSGEQLDAIVAGIRAEGGVAEAHVIDLTDFDAVATLAARLLADHGGIDVVVNNAGKSIRRSVALTYDRFHDFQRTIAVNYLGPVRLLLALLPDMRRRGGGQIVNVSTVAVRVNPSPRWGAYQASKAAFDVWFRSLGVEMRGDGVIASTVYMPLVYTRMSAPTPTLRNLPGLTPDAAAGLIARAVVRRSASVAPWWLFPIELGSVLFRRPLVWAMGRFFRRTDDSPRAKGLRDGDAPKPVGLRRALRRAGVLTGNPRVAARVARTILIHGGRLDSWCALSAWRHPDRIALIDEDGSLTFSELNDRMRRQAIALRDRLGVGPARPLAIMCRNGRSFVEALLAASALGADAILLNTEFPGPQLAQVLDQHPGARAIRDAEFADAFRGAGFPAEHVFDGAAEDAGGKLRSPRRQGRIVLLTSGTTGVPKGAARTLSRRALAGPLATLLTRTPLRAGSRILIATPLFHGFGLANLALGLFLGATAIARRRFAPDELLAAIARHRPDALVAVPTVLARLCDAAEAAPDADATSLRAAFSSGAPLGADLAERFTRRFGPCLFNLYGSSETGFGAMASPDDLVAAPGTVGHPPAGTDILILDDDGRPVPARTVGRVFLRSHLAFNGYVGGGDKARAAGGIDTGDLGHLDAAGRLFIDGRADEMIASGGEKVFPLEVEEALAIHPAIAQVAIVGVPDGQFGRRLKAFVVARPGERPDDESLRAFLRDRLARYKVPREFVWVTDLPRNALGKVLKGELDSATSPGDSGD